VYALEYCYSSHYVESSTFRHVHWALFPCHGRIYPPFLNIGLFKKVIAECIGRFVPDEAVNDKNLGKTETQG
jgi:hypothetical protein